MKVLIIAPHPDDEVLGCGGTIAKYARGEDTVYLCIVTKGYAPEWPDKFLKNRLKEVKKANKILGIKKTFFLDYPTAKLDTVSQKQLNEAICKTIKEVDPDILYVPHKGDLNKDHRVVFEASLVAARPINHKIKKILSYETLSETEWGQPLESFISNTYVDITETIGKKMEAMLAYKSELKPYPHPRSLKIIDALAKKRGSEIGVKFAESFMLIREII